MKRFSGKLIVLTLSLCLLLSLFMIHTAAQTGEDGEPEYYARTALAGTENAESLLRLYDGMEAGLAARESEIEIDLEGLTFETDMVSTAFYAVSNDHPEYYWVGGGYSGSLRQGTQGGVPVCRVTIRPDYYPWLLNNVQSVFDAAAQRLIASSGLTPGMSEYEKALRLHDALALWTEYDVGAANAHNAYGAIVEGQAVCEGYSEAYQYLLRLVGIQSLRVTGYGTDASGTVGHAWNLVRLDGNYYYTDVTWDDHGDAMKGVYYTYLNVTTAQISADHTFDDPGYPLPVCTATEANWFTQNPQNVLSAGNADKIAALFGYEDYVRIRYTGTPNDFGSWLSSNAYLVIRLIGADMNGASFNYIKNEYHLIVPGYEIPVCTHASTELRNVVSATAQKEGYTGDTVCTVCGALTAAGSVIPRITEPQVTVAVGTVTGRPGSTVSVPLTLSGTVPLDQLMLTLSFPSDGSLEFLGFSDYSPLITGSVYGIDSVHHATGEVELYYSSTVTPSGTLLCARFRVADNASEGDHDVSLTFSACSGNTQLITSVTAGAVRSEGTCWIPGDFNDDGTVDMQDAVHFIGWINFPRLSGLYPMIYEGSTDFNGDGTVNMQDAVYFIGWVNFPFVPDLYTIQW